MMLAAGRYFLFFPKKHALAEYGAGIPAENSEFMAMQALITAKNTQNTRVQERTR